MIKEKVREIYENLSVNKWPHVKRVFAFTCIILDKLNLNEKDKELVKISALLHDIGYKKQFEVGGDDVHEKYSCEMVDDILGGSYKKDDIEKIKETILTHGCFDDCNTLFQKILFDADKLDKTTFGEVIRKSIILHGKYKMNDLEIFKEFVGRVGSRKFHLDESKKIAEDNKKMLSSIFTYYSKFTDIVDEKEKEFNL